MNQKHPIDELFRSKLVDYELSPEAKLKQRFLERAQPKKKKVFPMWIFALAASFTAVLSFFWISNNDDTIVNSNNLSMQTKTVPTPNVPSKEVASAIKVEKAKDETASIEKIEAKRVVNTSKAQSKKKTLEEIEKVEATLPTGMSILDEPIPDELTIALLQAEKRESDASESADNSKKSTLFKKDVGETIIIVASEFKKEELIMLPEINSDSPMTMLAATEMAIEREDENSSLLAKVFTNIKHLKHGEKLDIIQTVRLEPDEDTFIGNEKREIEEKINWIKSKIAKR